MTIQMTEYDREIRAQNTVLPRQAAKYLGMTEARLRWMMQQDTEEGTHNLPIGIAVKKKRWSYHINGEKLFKYKHGLEMSHEKDVAQILEQISELMLKVSKLL